MRILMVVPHFVPEIGSAAHIYFDLAKALRDRGHEVDVITSYPRRFYLNQKDADRDFPLDEEIEGVTVHRSMHSATRDSILLRGLEHFLLSGLYFRTFRKLKKKFDICLTYIPPLPLFSFAKKLKNYDGTPSILNYQDFHPQELTDVGVLKNKLMIKFMEWLERKSYNRADHISVITEGGASYVRERGCRHDRITHIYNSFSLNNYQNVPGDFKEREGIQGKFLVTYAGILSPFQGLDVILEAAKKLRDDPDLVIYIVGDGMIKDHLSAKVADEDISNVRLLPLQPRDAYLNIISSSDACLVSLDDRMKAPCLPGKMANILAARKAVVAPVPSDSETARVVRTGGFGIVVDPQSAQELEEAIRSLKGDPSLTKRLGENGFTFVRTNMDAEINAARYESLFKEVVSQRGTEEGNSILPSIRSLFGLDMH